MYFLGARMNFSLSLSIYVLYYIIIHISFNKIPYACDMFRERKCKMKKNIPSTDPCSTAVIHRRRPIYGGFFFFLILFIINIIIIYTLYIRVQHAVARKKYKKKAYINIIYIRKTMEKIEKAMGAGVA